MFTIFITFFDLYFPLFPRFLPVILVPELFRKLRETPGKNSHQVWSKSVRSFMSYDQKPIFFFEILNFNFSALTVWFFNFWPQIRILRVEILLGHISACLKTSILKFRLLWIYSYFSLKMLSDAFYCFWLLFWSRSCLKSSGRLLGTISTKFRANPMSYDKKSDVISCNLMLIKGTPQVGR